ncbi:Uncharacterised protein [Vibrio cholerae]|nr:Uncharacterised protein [Vibrio cholerae]
MLLYSCHKFAPKYSSAGMRFNLPKSIHSLQFKYPFEQSS